MNRTKGFKKHAYWLIIFLFLYLFLTDLRLLFFGMIDITTGLLISRFIRYVIMFVPLVFIVNLSSMEKYHGIVKRGFLISLCLIAGSIIFSNQLHKIGILVQETDIYLANPVQDGFIRRAGIFRSLGDTNSAAGFLAVGLGYTLFSGDTRNQFFMNKVISGGIILAVLLTGSRIGLISTMLVFVIYLFSVRRFHKKFFLYLFFILIIAIATYLSGFSQPILDRFKDIQVGEGHLDPTYRFGRLGGWLFYLNYITSDFKTLFLGFHRDIYSNIGSFVINKKRVAHNFYIQLWYYWGIFALALFLRKIGIMIWETFQIENTNYLLSLILPFLLTLVFVSDTGVFLALIISIISISNKGSYVA
ncbi:MAG: O-antigen ligase family protein [Bacteroidales bacterium]|nr:O-antigen ligase family protein [Bacteroidales bacterium]